MHIRDLMSSSLPWGYVLSAVVVVASWIIYARIARRRALERGSDLPRRLAADGANKQSWRSAIGFVVVALMLVGGLLIVQRFMEARHPPVTEHRAELLDAAAKAASCGRDALTVLVEGPKRARVSGCGLAMTFKWKRPFRNSGTTRWIQIDPNCTMDAFGFKQPCD